MCDIRNSLKAVRLPIADGTGPALRTHTYAINMMGTKRSNIALLYEMLTEVQTKTGESVSSAFRYTFGKPRLPDQQCKTTPSSPITRQWGGSTKPHSYVSEKIVIIDSTYTNVIFLI